MGDGFRGADLAFCLSSGFGLGLVLGFGLSPLLLISHASMAWSLWALSMGTLLSCEPGDLSLLFSPALINTSSSASRSMCAPTPPMICTISSERSELRPYL